MGTGQYPYIDAAGVYAKHRKQWVQVFKRVIHCWCVFAPLVAPSGCSVHDARMNKQVDDFPSVVVLQERLGIQNQNSLSCWKHGCEQQITHGYMQTR